MPEDPFSIDINAGNLDRVRPKWQAEVDKSVRDSVCNLFLWQDKSGDGNPFLARPCRVHKQGFVDTITTVEFGSQFYYLHFAEATTYQKG